MRALLLAALLTGFAAAAPAAELPAVLGNEGEIYRVVHGTHAQLDPRAASSTADHPALALEVVHPDKKVTRTLVPGTEDDAVEQYPALTLDKATNTVFLVWETQRAIHSGLNLTAFVDGAWSDSFELSGDAFSFKSNPRMVATADSYLRLAADGSTVERTRVVLHLVWWDESGYGGRPLYTGLLVEDGRFVPHWEVFSLTDLLPPAGELGDGPLGLYGNPQVYAGGDGRSAVVAFGDRGGSRIATVEVRPLSGSIVSLADEARAQIIDIGASLAGDRPAFAAAAHARIADLARRVVDAEAAAFLAASVAGAIATAPAGEAVSLTADKARAQIIDIGARLTGGPRVLNGEARAQIIDIGRASQKEPGYPCGWRVTSVRPTPWVPERTIKVLTGPEGDEVALAWDGDTAVKYRITQRNGWSDVRTLALDDKMSREQAYALIQRRLGPR